MSKIYTSVKFRKYIPKYTPVDDTEKKARNADKIITIARIMLICYALIMAMDIATSSINVIASLALWLILK